MGLSNGLDIVLKRVGDGKFLDLGHQKVVSSVIYRGK